jgi:hypothetical protein
MLVNFKDAWKDGEGTRYRRGWAIVADDVAAEARAAGALHTAADQTPPADYAALWAEQTQAEREAKREQRRAARQATATKAEG